MALFLALLSLSYSNSQTIDPTTGNLINSGTTPTGTTSTWNNGVYVNTICFQAGQPGNCGPNPSVRPGGNINFSYGTTDLNQVVNINRALAAGGSGVQLSGFNFGFMAKNGNGWDDGRQDYLAASVKFYDAAGGLAANYDYTSQTNRKYNWTQFNFSETFANPVAASNYSNARVGFVGRDNNYWAGNYGPEIYNVSFSLKYRVDPCSTNPAYAPTCAGFNNVVTSGNLINPNSMSNGNIVYNTFAVNTALQNSGSGVEVYGFKYGYNYSLGNGRYECTATNQDGSCSWYMTTNPTAQVRVQLTNNTNDVIYSAIQSRNTPNTAENVSYQFLLPSTTNSTALGNFTLGASTTGNAAIQNMFVNALYKPDPCFLDPLSSASCPGYGAAYAAKLSSAASTTTPAIKATAATVTTTDSAATSSSPSVNVGGVQMSSSGTISAPDNIPQALKDVQAIAQQSQATSTQAAAGSSTQQQQQSTKSGPNMSLIMSVIGQIQAADKATQSSAVQNANQVAAASSARAQEQANQVVETLNTMSQSSSQASMIQYNATTQTFTQSSQTSGSVVQLLSPTANNQMSMGLSAQSNSLVQNQSVASLTQTQQVQLNTFQTQAASSFGSFAMISLTPPQSAAPKLDTQQKTDSMLSMLANTATIDNQPKFENKQQDSDTTVSTVNTNLNRNVGTNDFFASKINFESMQSEQTSDGVKKNVSPNDLAGSVDIASIATLPKGYEAYGNLVLKDADFYKSEAIYKDQRTVDNARALRQLSSDRLHQEMIDQQYRR